MNLIFKKIVSVLKDNKLKNNYKFIITEELPQGPADPVRQSLEVINNDNAVVIINADQYLDFEFPIWKRLMLEFQYISILTLHLLLLKLKIIKF